MKETDAAAVADALPILMLLLPSPPTLANTDATNVNTAKVQAHLPMPEDAWEEI